jgi:hypothetical protein
MRRVLRSTVAPIFSSGVRMLAVQARDRTQFPMAIPGHRPRH